MTQLRILVVGSEAGGLSAATRARRMNEHANITVLESGDQLALTPEQLGRRYRIDARVRHDVERIDRVNQRVEGIDRSTGSAFSLPYDRLVLAARSQPVFPQIPGCDAANVFALSNADDARQLDAYLTEGVPVNAVVVGSGFGALERVQALSERGLNVTVIENGTHALPALDAEMGGWLEAELMRHGVRVLVNTSVRALTLAEEGLVEAVETESGGRIATELVLFALAGRPDTALAKQAGLALGASGKILVDAQSCTSDPHIYAVGDAAERSAGRARGATAASTVGVFHREGRSAGEHAATGRAQATRSGVGTAVVRVFGLDVGVTGLGLLAAREHGYDADSALVDARDRTGRAPASTPFRLRIVYERGSGDLLGAQILGPSGVAKLVDVFAAALHFRAKLSDLSDLDLASFPRFPGCEPVQLAALVAQNQEREPGSTTHEPEAGALLVDVRDASETRAGMLPRALHIPLDELRERLSELDRARPIVVYSELGRRGYLASRILRQHGFTNVKNLRGGYAQAHTRLQS